MNDLCIVNCASNMANYHEMGLVSVLELVPFLYGMTRLATMNFLPLHRDSEYCKREEAQASLTGGIRGALEVAVTRERKSIIGARMSCHIQQLFFL